MLLLVLDECVRDTTCCGVVFVALRRVPRVFVCVFFSRLELAEHVVAKTAGVNFFFRGIGLKLEKMLVVTLGWRWCSLNLPCFFTQ